MPNEVTNIPYQILGTTSEGYTVQLQADKFTKSLETISTDHSDVHNQKGYSISGLYTNVANSASVNYAFKTPTLASGKLVHLKYSDIQSTSTKVRTDFYEKPTNAPTEGSDITAFNHYRVGTPTPSTMQAIKLGTTYDGTGATMLDYHYILTSTKTTDFEWILKPDTWYVRIFTNLSGSAVDISFHEFWVEE